MKTLFEELCIIHSDKRFIEEYDHYNTLTDEERLYIKSNIAFVYEYYKEQQSRTCEYTQQYSMCELTFTRKPIEFLLALLPSTISIPPLIALLLPAQILSIPILINFDAIPSHYILTAIELLGIEDIFIDAQSSLAEQYNQEEIGKSISSQTYHLKNTIWHYTPPILPKEAFDIPTHTWLYPDARYQETQKAHVSHTIKANISHLWIYPCISLDCYYSIDYIMR